MTLLRALLTTALTALASLALAGCGGAAGLRPLAPRHDLPVPPGEPRAELRLRVDLPPGAGCEEDFDLALYRDRGVDLIQWDERAGACAGRGVTIRYLTQRTSAAELLGAVRKLAASVEEIPVEPETKR